MTINKILYFVRGGGWFYVPQSARVTNRYYFTPDFRFIFLGFRLVEEVN